jgi:hypothetical protein
LTESTVRIDALIQMTLQAYKGCASIIRMMVASISRIMILFPCFGWAALMMM